MPVEITDKAKQQIERVASNSGSMVRLSISSGGCQGFNKNWDLTKTIDDDDVQYQCGETLLLIDQGSLDIIDGATIDYKTDLGGSVFTVSIPHAISTCGCGNSFSIT